MIYIQSDQGIPHHFDCSCALYGSIDSAMDYKLVTMDDVISGKLDQLIRRNYFVGSVEFMKSVFSRINIEGVGVPENSNRPHKSMSLKDAHEYASNVGKVFIKPFDIKLFTGLVLDGFKYSCLSGLPDETKVMVYDVFDSKIESEYRIYVHKGVAIDSRNYSGDFKLNPDWDYVDRVIFDNNGKFPISYTIDIGVLSSGENVVIEYNDMWAIGNYGIPNDLYLRLLMDRYKEIVNKDPYTLFKIPVPKVSKLSKSVYSISDWDEDESDFDEY